MNADRLPAFSLIEVVAALAIFAVGIVSVAGLFGSLLGSLTEREDDAIAAGLMVPLRLELRRRVNEANALTPVRALIPATKGEVSATTPKAAAVFLFAPRSGAFVAGADDPRWVASGALAYFAVSLESNRSLPYGADGGSLECVTYTAEVRWPVARGAADSTQAVPPAPAGQSRIRFQGAMSP